MPPLDRALALAEMQDLAVGIGEKLKRLDRALAGSGVHDEHVHAGDGLQQAVEQ